MNTKSLTLDLPEDLLDLAQASHIDLRQTMIEALERKIHHRASLIVAPTVDSDIEPSLAAVEAAINASEARLAAGNVPVREIGYLQGKIWISPDFDDELPDAFWFGEEP